MIAVSNLKEKLGTDNVILDEAVLAEYSRDVSFVNPIQPGCIVRPKKPADVESLVKLANESLMPLVPVSSGPPHFRGDTVPGIGGAAIVDLSGLKRIIRVDRLNRVAMVEPGVTFAELIPAVQSRGLRLNMPLQPRISKSVAGSLLEREPVTMPAYHWDMADPLNCVEIVFGNGEVFRTGSAAGPGSIEAQWAAKQAQTDAAGPSQASFHTLVQGAQGTLGIVTWVSMRCEILPQIEEPFLVGCNDVRRILDLAQWLVKLRLVNECFVLNNTNLAAISAKQWPGDYQTIKDSLPGWILFFNIAGYDYLPQKRVDYQSKDMRHRAQSAGLEPLKVIGKVLASELLALTQRPSEDAYWKLRYKGACQDIFFLGMYDQVPDLVQAMPDMADKAGYPAPDIGIYLQPIAQGTNCHCEFNLFYDAQNPGEADRVASLSVKATKNFLDMGAFFSRPYGESTKLVFNRDAGTTGLLKKVKSVFDPNNIMNPGKLCF
jgi:FAD/FMN-containing dehydrogenase